MPEATTKPPSSRPKSPEARRSSRPARARLAEALADAEKMAKRVDRALEQDPFAAALLAREYLSLVQELDVNPLNQRGGTDAWTSAFVRLRVASNKLDRHERRADGEAYLAARAEERRLVGLFGTKPRARLLAVRAEARKKRARRRAYRVTAWLSMVGALLAVGVAYALHRPWIAVYGGTAGALGAAVSFAVAAFAARALTTATENAQELETGISALSRFEKGESGRAIIQRLQREHPLLVHTSLGESSMPPAASR